MVWVSMMARNSLFSGSGASAATTLIEFEQRQAGLDAAHDDVDGVGQRLEELLFAALLQEAQHPARQAEAGGKRHAEAAEQAAADR